MEGNSAIEYLLTYGWMLLVVAIVGAAVVVSVQNTESGEPINKTQVMQVVERGAGQNCEWSEYSRYSGQIDCIQEFEWKNRSYKVHDYFGVKIVDETVEITQ
jgi:hypothetical protein